MNTYVSIPSRQPSASRRLRSPVVFATLVACLLFTLAFTFRPNPSPFSRSSFHTTRLYVKHDRLPVSAGDLFSSSTPTQRDLDAMHWTSSNQMDHAHGPHRVDQLREDTMRNTIDPHHQLQLHAHPHLHFYSHSNLTKYLEGYTNATRNNEHMYHQRLSPSRLWSRLFTSPRFYSPQRAAETAAVIHNAKLRRLVRDIMGGHFPATAPSAVMRDDPMIGSFARHAHDNLDRAPPSLSRYLGHEQRSMHMGHPHFFDTTSRRRPPLHAFESEFGALKTIRDKRLMEHTQNKFNQDPMHEVDMLRLNRLAHDMAAQAPITRTSRSI